MKTDRFLISLHTHGMGSRLAGRIGTQIAAVLLAVLVTPSMLPVRDTHSHAAPAPDRSAALRTPGWR